MRDKAGIEQTAIPPYSKGVFFDKWVEGNLTRQAG
jgi:hypothetical protein